MNHAAKVAQAVYHRLSESFHTRTLNGTLTMQEVINLFSDIRLAFGESDEYSFVLHKGTTLYGMSL